MTEQKNKSNKTKLALKLPTDSDRIPVPDDKSIMVIPLGGVGQIGMNWTLYGHKGRWVLVDAGSAFAPRDLKGVEAIYPDLACVSEIIPRLSALVVTHAHEDHIGAIHRLWPHAVNCPIYATPFAAQVLHRRFEERETDGDVTIRVFKPGKSISIGSFLIKTVRMTHSIAECVALAFQTSVGTVLHTGDWKFDPRPAIGKPTDTSALCQLGRDGVLAMVSDSTNATRIGKITSEGDLLKGFKKVFRDHRGMAVVSCFATNVHRMATVLRAAKASGRQVALAGRSMQRNEEIARELGMLDDVPPPLARLNHLRGLNPREIVLLCTGTQGEANAALSRLGDGDDYRLPRVRPKDVVIHSARCIPGNEEYLLETFDKLRARGAKIIDGDYMGLPLHATGHATAGEIAKMYEMVKPRFAIPVHGEDEHIEAHASLALSKGVEAVVRPSEGDIFRVSQSGIEQVGKIDLKLEAEIGDFEHSKIRWDEDEVRAVFAKIDADRAALGYADAAPEHEPAPLMAMGM